MKGKITAVLFIIVFLLVVAVVFTFLTSLDRRREAAANEPVNNDVVVTEITPTPAPTAEVVMPTGAVPYQAPTQSAAAAPTPMPSATPTVVVTPEPAVIETASPAEQIVTISDTVPDMGAILGSGSFTSNTGKTINIRADWEARVSGANEISVKVTIVLLHFQIYVNELPNAVNIGLNGQYVTLGSPAISYDSKTAQAATELASQSFTVQLPEGSSRDLDLQAEWQWGGTWGGEYIPVIECGGTFTVRR